MVHDLIDEESPFYKLFKLIEGKGKVRTQVDAAFFYCPYIPLTYSGVIVDPITMKSVTTLLTRYQGTLNNLVKVYTP